MPDPVRSTTVNAIPTAAGTNRGGSDSAERHTKSPRGHLDVDMVLIRSQSAERLAQMQQKPTTDPDPREQLQVVVALSFTAPCDV